VRGAFALTLHQRATRSGVAPQKLNGSGRRQISLYTTACMDLIGSIKSVASLFPLLNRE
jgi:hypothetical protein